MFGNEMVGCISYCWTDRAPQRFFLTAALALDANIGKSLAASVQGLFAPGWLLQLAQQCPVTSFSDGMGSHNNQRG